MSFTITKPNVITSHTSVVPNPDLPRSRSASPVLKPKPGYVLPPPAVIRRPFTGESVEDVLANSFVNLKFGDAKPQLASLLDSHKSRISRLQSSGNLVLEPKSEVQKEAHKEKDRLEHRITSIQKLRDMLEDQPTLQIATIGFSEYCNNCLSQVPGLSALDTVVIKDDEDVTTVFRLSNSISMQERGVLAQVKHNEIKDPLCNFISSNLSLEVSTGNLGNITAKELSGKFFLNNKEVGLDYFDKQLALIDKYAGHLKDYLISADDTSVRFNQFIIGILEQIGKIDENQTLDPKYATFLSSPEFPDDIQKLALAKYRFLATLEELAPSVSLVQHQSKKEGKSIDINSCKAIALQHYNKTNSIFKRSSLSSSWKTHNGRAEIFSHYGLDGDTTIDAWHKLAKTNMIDVVINEWQQYKKDFEEIGINSFNEDAIFEQAKSDRKSEQDKSDRTVVIFPEFINTKNEGLGEKDGFFLSPGLTPYSQVVGKSGSPIKLVSVLINASQNYSLFKFPDDSFTIDCNQARDLLFNLKDCSPESLMPWIKKTLGISEKESRTIELKLLKQLAGYRRFADHKGLCCPNCSGSSDDKCELIRIPESKIDISVSDEGIFDSLNFTFDGRNFKVFLDSYYDQMKSFLDNIQDGDNNTLIESVRGEFAQYYEKMSDYQKHADFKYAMLLDFSNHFLSMLIQNRDSSTDASKKAELTKIISKFRQFLTGVLDCFVTELDKISSVKDENSSLYVSRFYYAECIKFATILGSDDDSKVEYSDAAKSYINKIKIKLGDKEEREWFNQFRCISLPKMKGLDVTQDLSKQIINYFRPITVNLLTGEQGVGKSEVKSGNSKSKDPLTYKENGKNRIRTSNDSNDSKTLFILENDEAGAQKGDGAYPEGEMRITFDKSKMKQALADLESFEITYDKASLDLKHDADHDGKGAVVPGCICCKDRDIALQMLADINSSGNDDVGSTLIEPTGIADGAGILNMSQAPIGRFFWEHNIMLVHPKNPLWGSIEKIVDECEKKDKTYDKFTDYNYKTAKGLNLCDEIKDDKTFNRLKVLLAPCLNASGLVINDRDNVGEQEKKKYKERFTKIMQFVNGDGHNFDCEVMNCKTEVFRFEDFNQHINLNVIKREITDFVGEFGEAELEPKMIKFLQDSKQMLVKWVKKHANLGSIVRLKGSTLGNRLDTTSAATKRLGEVQVAAGGLVYVNGKVEN